MRNGSNFEISAHQKCSETRTGGRHGQPYRMTLLVPFLAGPLTPPHSAGIVQVLLYLPLMKALGEALCPFH